MNDIELSWVAGLLEGEGSFLWRVSNSAKVSCQMTDQDVILRLHSLIGGKVYQATKQKSHHKTAWVCVVSGLDAVELMEQVFPLMGFRRSEQIKNVLTLFYAHEAESVKKKGAARENALFAALEYLDEWKRGDRSLRRVASKYGISHVTLKKVIDVSATPAGLV